LNAHFAKNNSNQEEKQQNTVVDIASQNISLFCLANKELKNARMEKFSHVLFALLNFTRQLIALTPQNIALVNVHLLPILITPKKHELQAL